MARLTAISRVQMLTVRGINIMYSVTVPCCWRAANHLKIFILNCILASYLPPSSGLRSQQLSSPDNKYLHTVTCSNERSNHGPNLRKFLLQGDTRDTISNLLSSYRTADMFIVCAVQFTLQSQLYGSLSAIIMIFCSQHAPSFVVYLLIKSKFKSHHVIVFCIVPCIICIISGRWTL